MRRMPKERRSTVHTLLHKRWQHYSSCFAKYVMVLEGLSVEGANQFKKKRQLENV